MTTLKLGADLVTVLCSIEAAVPIKSYSPELMTRPTLIPSHMLTIDGLNPHAHKGQTKEAAVKEVAEEVKKEVLEKTNVVIIGPGLGKDPLIISQVSAIIEECRGRDIPIILDGDGINIACQPSTLHLLKGYKSLICTPNAAEFRRLWEAHLPHTPPPPMSLPVNPDLLSLMTEHREMEGGRLPVDSPFVKHTVELAQAMGGVTILRKGPVDVMSDGKEALFCCRQGALRRSGCDERDRKSVV